MSKYSQFTVSGYNITSDPSFQNERYGTTEDLREQFAELFFQSQDKKNKEIIPRLTALILKYPKSPQLKNYLSVAYSVRGNYKKAAEVNNWTLAEHPDYLFARLNLANECITNGEAAKATTILGEAMEIKELYPERDLFHLGEVTGFYKVAIRYYAAIKNLELAENRLKVLQEIAPEHPDTISAEEYVISLRLAKGFERWEKEDASRIKVTCIKPVPVSKQKAPPVFNHAEIYDLYQNGLRIDPEKLKEILALPRETVIADLEQILRDAIDRYNYFKGLDQGEEKDTFPLHAICLLAELKSENSVATILNFLENNEEVLDFWLGDHLTSTIWLHIYLLSPNRLELLKQFLVKPGIHTYSKTAVSEALCQMGLQHPEKREEIAALLQEVLSYFSQAGLNDNLIDSDFLGLAIGDIMDCGLIELLPVIKELSEKKYVNEGINGSYEKVVAHFQTTPKSYYKKDIDNIFKLYNDIVTDWAGYSEDEDDYPEIENSYPEIEEDYLDNDFLDDYEIPQPAVSVKIGRNDPCPCGSGKKFKKCCIDKLPL